MARDRQGRELNGLQLAELRTRRAKASRKRREARGELTRPMLRALGHDPTRLWNAQDNEGNAG